MSKRYDSKQADASLLGRPLPFEFSGRTAPNRFLKAAMTERVCTWSTTDIKSRGVPTEKLINLYRRWGEGQFGVILSGNIMIDYDQLEAPGNPIVPFDAPTSGERFEAFQKVAQAATKDGALFIAQISHPGRQVIEQVNNKPLSASDVQLEGSVLGMTFAKPHAATKEDIKHVVDSFAYAASFLEKAGYDGAQLHGAHGYLLAQFLSQTTNRRTDEYGGSLENRARIIIEIADAVRKQTKPDFVLGIKINSVEFQEKGFAPEEAKELAALLEKHRFDFIELSGGTYESLAFVHKRESTKKREAFFLDFADTITPALNKTKSYVTGGLKTVGAMVDALKSVDGVGLGRPVAQEPTLPRDILAGKVTGSIEQIFDQNDFGTTNVVAGTQMRQVGKDTQPFDGSDPKSVEAFKQDMGTWAQSLAADPNNYGYVDVNSIAAVPYGQTTA